MIIKLGTLEFTPALERADLVAEPVAVALGSITEVEKVGVVEIDLNLSDTAAFCEHYKVGMEIAANCVVLEAKRAERVWYAACVILGSTRVDVNKVARRALDARKISFAPMEKAVELSGMEYGAITPVGLPADWPILIDEAVADSDYVIIGSGIRKTKLAVPGMLLGTLPNAEIIEGLAH